MRSAKPHGFALNRKVAGRPVIPLVEPVGLHRAKSLLRRSAQGRTRVFRVAPNDHAAAPGNQIDQPAKSQFISLKIRIDVGVIVFERSNDQVIGMIVKKFGSPVPKGRLILVAFKDELLPAAEPITLSEVLRHAPHQKIRALGRGLKNPGQHGRRSRFSMCSADNDGMPLGKKHFLQYFRHRTISNLAVQNFLELWIPARDYVADDHKIGRRLQVRCIKLTEKRYPQAFQQSGSGWIDSGIRPGHAKAVFAKHPSQRRHRRSANPDYMHMFCCAQATTADSSNSSVPSPSASRRALMPSGIVSMGRTVCPMGAPNTMGTPSGRRIRAQTSRTLGAPATAGSLSGKSPSTIPRTPSNFPACFKCIKTRSTW